MLVSVYSLLCQLLYAKCTTSCIVILLHGRQFTHISVLGPFLYAEQLAILMAKGSRLAW